MRFGNWNFSNVPLKFASPLGPAAWAVLAGIPIGIIALYFLKLRRRPIQVPSTILWRKSIEDLHVNSLFQWLRKNLLLYLQLLAVFLAMAALAGPKFQGTSDVKQRYILMIDHSASMSATDVKPTRLDKAKSEARKVIEGMKRDDLAMIISFSDRARVVSSYSGNRGVLLARLEEIRPTSATTNLLEALQVAAGLANPTRQFGEGVEAASIDPPKLTIFTDGGFEDVSGFSLGNLVPEYIRIGPPPDDRPNPAVAEKSKTAKQSPSAASDNAAILALQTAKNEEAVDTYQVFGRVRNYRAEPVTTKAVLLKHDPEKPAGSGTVLDVKELTIDARSDQSFEFDLKAEGAVEMEVAIDVRDALAVDNRAFTTIAKPRRAQVLLVTAGNRYLTDNFRTSIVRALAEVREASPEEFQKSELSREVASGRFDLLVLDGVRPERDPPANVLYIGVMPPGKAFEKTRPMETPIVVLNYDAGHPLLQFVRDLSTVEILKATSLIDPPAGLTRLAEGNDGLLAFSRPRDGFIDVVLAFPILEGSNINTNWPLKYSFPLFFSNCLRLLGNTLETAGDEVHRPGAPIVLRADSSTRVVTVQPPPWSSHRIAKIRRGSLGNFVYNDTDAPGLYHARWDKDGARTIAVNLFDRRESDLSTRAQIEIGHTPIAGVRRAVSAPVDRWKALAVLALLVVLFEWYIYNRRVYI